MYRLCDGSLRGRSSEHVFAEKLGRARRPGVVSATGGLRAALTLTSWLLVLGIPALASAQDAGLQPGDVLVMNNAALLEIDAATGAGHVVSDFRDARQGPTLPLQPPRPFSGGLALEGPTSVLLAHSHFGNKGAVLRVDVSTGRRTLLTDFGDPAQGPLAHPAGVTGQLTILPSGDLLAIDLELLFRVDRVTGMRTVISDFGEVNGGPPVNVPTGLASDTSGQVFVSLPRGGQSGQGAVLRVDTTTGNRVVVSDFGDAAQGPTGTAGFLAVDVHGRIIVSDGQENRLLEVDPVTGLRILLSDFTDPGQGLTSQPRGLAVEDTGNVVVAGGSLVHLVDRATGMRALLATAAATFTAVAPAVIVTDEISLSSLTTAIDHTSNPDAPHGTFTVTATFMNTGLKPLRSPFVRVTELSGGNVLLNADRRAGGAGARLTPDVGSDGILSPGESMTVEFAIGLYASQPFSFFVDILSAPDDGG